MSQIEKWLISQNNICAHSIPPLLNNFFYFFRLIPPDEPKHTKRYPTLIPRSHTHQTVGHEHTGNIFLGTFFPEDSFFWDFLSGDCFSIEPFLQGFRKPHTLINYLKVWARWNYVKNYMWSVGTEISLEDKQKQFPTKINVNAQLNASNILSYFDFYCFFLLILVWNFLF